MSGNRNPRRGYDDQGQTRSWAKASAREKRAARAMYAPDRAAKVAAGPFRPHRWCAPTHYRAINTTVTICAVCRMAKMLHFDRPVWTEWKFADGSLQRGGVMPPCQKKGTIPMTTDPR